MKRIALLGAAALLLVPAPASARTAAQLKRDNARLSKALAAATKRVGGLQASVAAAQARAATDATTIAQTRAALATAATDLATSKAETASAKNAAAVATNKYFDTLALLGKAQADGTASASQVASLTTQLASMTTARDNALQGLPNAILAVPSNQMWTMVFTPARQEWPCDSYATYGGFWTLSFDSTC